VHQWVLSKIFQDVCLHKTQQWRTRGLSTSFPNVLGPPCCRKVLRQGAARLCLSGRTAHRAARWCPTSWRSWHKTGPPRYIELVNGVYKPTNITSGLSMVHGDDPQKIGLKSDRRDPTQKTSWDEKQPFIWMNATKLAGWWFQAWILCSSSYMGCHPSHWRTHIFQDGYCTTNQAIV